MRNNCSFRSLIVTHKKLEFTPIRMSFHGLDLAFSKVERNLCWFGVLIIAINSGNVRF